jgi:hypothetical protein
MLFYWHYPEFCYWCDLPLILGIGKLEVSLQFRSTLV